MISFYDSLFLYNIHYAGLTGSFCGASGRAAHAGRHTSEQTSPLPTNASQRAIKPHFTGSVSSKTLVYK